MALDISLASHLQALQNLKRDFFSYPIEALKAVAGAFELFLGHLKKKKPHHMVAGAQRKNPRAAAPS